MRALTLAVVALLVGCGGAGPVGPVGPTGPSGPPGATADAGVDVDHTLAWYDATGAFAAYATNGALFLDARGYFWPISTETAALFELRPFSKYYMSSDCTGRVYINEQPSPRVPFKVQGDSVIYVRGDGVTSAMVTFASAVGTGSCQTPSAPFSLLAIPLDAMLAPPPAIVQPALSFSPPLHLEAR